MTIDDAATVAEMDKDQTGVVTVRMGDLLYERLLGPIRADRVAMARIWREAESRLDERPGTVWYIAVVGSAAAAWIAVGEDGEALHVHDHYEMPSWRGRGLYALLVEYVHRTVIAPSGKAAATYVFETPMRHLAALGWTVTGEGDSDEKDAPSHHWWGMEWAPRRS